jgi:hypothetical protein
MMFGGNLLAQHTARHLDFDLERDHRVDESARRLLDAPILRRQSIHPDTSILADLLTERSVYVTVS